MQKDSLRKIIAYLLLTFVLSSISYYFIISNDSLSYKGGIFIVTLMWTPGLSALILSLIMDRSLKPLGWKWGKTRYQLTAYLLPVLYAFIVYALVWLFIDGSFKPGDFNQNLLPFFLSGTVMSLFTALGEEIGWRGFLVPNLYKYSGSFLKTGLISGVIWAVWHWPILLFADYNSGTNVYYALICFSLMAIGISFVMAWLRIKSGSLWTAMFLHASHNFYIQGYFDEVTRNIGSAKWITTEFGIGLAIVALIFAWFFYRKRKELPVA